MFSKTLIGPDVPECRPQSWLDNKYCYQCRVGRTMPSLDHETLRICDACHMIQDFLVKCAHPACAGQQGIPSWCFTRTPSELATYNYFCSDAHANALFEITQPVCIYKDSDSHAHIQCKIASVPMSTTVGDFIALVMKRTLGLSASTFVLCIDVQRSLSNQINYLQDHSLLYVALSKLHNVSGLKMLLIPRSEYDAQMTAYGTPARLFEPEQREFVLSTGTHAQVVGWLKARGLTGSSLVQAGTDGPKITHNAPYAIVAYVSQSQLQTLFQMGFSESLVCPYLLRRKHALVILACENNKPHQEVLFDTLCKAWQAGSEQYVTEIFNAFRQFGIGQFAVDINVDEPLHIHPPPLEEDAEGAFGEEGEEPKKRRRTPTTALTLEDLGKLNFSVVHQKSLIRMVRAMRASPQPFCVPNVNKDGIFYVCIPMLEDCAQRLLDSGRIHPMFVTRPCFISYRLVMIPSSDDKEAQMELCARCVAASSEDALFEIISSTQSTAIRAEEFIMSMEDIRLDDFQDDDLF